MSAREAIGEQFRSNGTRSPPRQVMNRRQLHHSLENLNSFEFKECRIGKLAELVLLDSTRPQRLSLAMEEAVDPYERVSYQEEDLFIWKLETSNAGGRFGAVRRARSGRVQCPCVFIRL